MFSGYRRVAGSIWFTPIEKNGFPSGVTSHQRLLFSSRKKPVDENFGRTIRFTPVCHQLYTRSAKYRCTFSRDGLEPLCFLGFRKVINSSGDGVRPVWLRETAHKRASQLQVFSRVVSLDHCSNPLERAKAHSNPDWQQRACLPFRPT